MLATSLTMRRQRGFKLRKHKRVTSRCSESRVDWCRKQTVLGVRSSQVPFDGLAAKQILKSLAKMHFVANAKYTTKSRSATHQPSQTHHATDQLCYLAVCNAADPSAMSDIWPSNGAYIYQKVHSILLALHSTALSGSCNSFVGQTSVVTAALCCLNVLAHALSLTACPVLVFHTSCMCILIALNLSIKVVKSNVT